MLPAAPAARWDVGNSPPRGRMELGGAERKDPCSSPLPPAAGGLRSARPSGPRCVWGGGGWVWVGGWVQQGGPATGSSCARSPPRARHAGASPPTAGGGGSTAQQDPGSSRPEQFLQPTGAKSPSRLLWVCTPTYPLVLGFFFFFFFFPPPASEQLIFIPFPARLGNSNQLNSPWKHREGKLGFSFSLPCCKVAAESRVEEGTHPCPPPRKLDSSSSGRTEPRGDFSAAGCVAVIPAATQRSQGVPRGWRVSVTSVRSESPRWEKAHSGAARFCRCSVRPHPQMQPKGHQLTTQLKAAGLFFFFFFLKFFLLPAYFL
ncbi:uncharacterized protein LOC116960738 [Tyto alba]|uniref:uncharacterized protein LOC116960738 n=1 Tax=Tyto alba TaxID=56313 RepID=UPI001C672030|nr:uncharacterized protein LOC116960738 [Tyto alba]